MLAANYACTEMRKTTVYNSALAASEQKKNFCMSELKHVACGVDCELAASHDLRQLLKLLLPEHLRPVSKGWATRLHGTHWTDGMAGARMSRCRRSRAEKGNWGTGRQTESEDI